MEACQLKINVRKQVTHELPSQSSKAGDFIFSGVLVRKRCIASFIKAY